MNVTSKLAIRDAEAYAELLELIDEAGFTIVSSDFSTAPDTSDFNVDLWLEPPTEESE